MYEEPGITTRYYKPNARYDEVPVNRIQSNRAKCMLESLAHLVVTHMCSVNVHFDGLIKLTYRRRSTKKQHKYTVTFVDV